VTGATRCVSLPSIVRIFRAREARLSARRQRPPSLRTLDSGTIYTFVPTDLRFPQVATLDIARTAAAALVERVPRGQTRIIELAGPRELSGDDVGRALTAIVGKPISVEAAALDTVVPTLTRFGLANELAELLREEYGSFPTPFPVLPSVPRNP
jgi:uncharacterized protein YbjT (DUF2867 family)